VRLAHLVPSLAPVIIFGACGSGTSAKVANPDRCFIVTATVSPSPAVVAIGDSVHLSAAFTGPRECTPSVPAARWQWWSSDTTVATVDSMRGVVTARRAGQAVMTVHVPGSSAGLGGGTVQVVAR
jgi:uncharacterized protein YjdB